MNETPPTVEEVIAAVVNTSPVKAVHSRSRAIASAVATELRARGLLVEVTDDADDHPLADYCPTCGGWYSDPAHPQDRGCDEAAQVEIEGALLPPGMTEADLLRSTLRQVLAPFGDVA